MLIATSTAVFRLDTQSGQIEPLQVYESHDLRCIAQGRHNELVGLVDGRIAVWTGTQVQCVDCGIGEPIESLLILSEQPLDVLAGTEGAHLLRLRDQHCRRVESFDRLSVRPKWHTPWGGPPAVRSLATNGAGAYYADIHVGSIMRSGDHGRTWKPVEPTLDEDVHQVATCPAAPRRVYANTARSVYISSDGGRSWEHRGEGLGFRYGRAIAVHPAEPDTILASASDGPHGPDVHGGLYWTEDAGQTWKHIAEHFPASTPHNINTHHVLYTAEGTPWAVAGQMLYLGRDRGSRWEMFWRAPDAIRMIAAPMLAEPPAETADEETSAKATAVRAV